MSVSGRANPIMRSMKAEVSYETFLLYGLARDGKTRRFFDLIRRDEDAAKQVVYSGMGMSLVYATHGKSVEQLVEESGERRIDRFLKMLRRERITPNWPAAFEIANYHMELANDMIRFPLTSRHRLSGGLELNLRDVIWNRWEELRPKVPMGIGILTRFQSPKYL